MTRAVLLVLLIVIGCDKSASKGKTAADGKPATAWHKLLDDPDPAKRAGAIVALYKAGDPAALESFNSMPATKEKLALAKDLDRPAADRAAVLRAYLEAAKSQWPPEEASPTVLELCESDAGRQAVRSQLLPYFKTRATERQTDSVLWQHENLWQALHDQAEKAANP